MYNNRNNSYITQERLKYPNAYKPWTAALNELLERGFKSGTTLDELTELLGRSRGAIVKQLELLKLIDECEAVAKKRTYDPSVRKKSLDLRRAEIRKNGSALSDTINHLLTNISELNNTVEVAYRDFPYVVRLENLIKIAIGDMLDNGWYSDEASAMEGLACRLEGFEDADKE